MIIDDFATLPSSARVTDEGFLELTGNIARVGVMAYSGKELGKDPGKVYKLYRSPEIVKLTAEKLKNKPVTVNHPKGGIDIHNSDKEFSGTLTDTWFDDATGWAKGKILLTHKKAIKAFFDGFNQLSVGAKQVELDDFKGEYDGESYDMVVKALSGNHVALVEKARAGDNATFDSQNDSINIDNVGIIQTLIMEKKFSISLFDGSSVELSGDNAKDIFKTFETLTKDSKDLNGKVVKLTDSIGSLESEIESLKVLNADLTKQLDAANGELEAKKLQLSDAANTSLDADSRKAWLQTYAEVKPMLNDSGDAVFGLSVADLKRAAIKAQKGLDLSDKSDDYVDAFYAGLQQSNSAKTSPAQDILVNTQDAEASGDALAKAFASHNERIAKNAYSIFGGN
jgi:hypothetical protein